MLKPEDLNAMLAEYWPACPFACEELSAHSALASLRVRPGDIRPGGFVSGPTLFGAADAALWFLAAAVRGRPEPMALTSDLAIRYLAPAQGEQVFALAELNRGSGRFLVGSVSLWMDDRREEPCAVAQGAYVLPRSSSG